MKLTFPQRGPRPDAAFTMVEIALSIAVVAFALVAILGILPTGFTVQKDNREDTIINQEGAYWIEAITGGARGLAQLTNSVEAITITNQLGVVLSVTNQPGSMMTPEQVVGLLSWPKYQLDPSDPARWLTNRVLARVRAITGLATEQTTLTNEAGFRYQVQVDITETSVIPADLADEFRNADRNTPLGLQKHNSYIYSSQIAGTLYDIRLVLRWPIYERGNSFDVGTGRKVFRTAVAGTHLAPRTVGQEFPTPGFFLQANRFHNAKSQ